MVRLIAPIGHAGREPQMMPGTAQYGSSLWLENLFRARDGDPWGLTFRGLELHRYDAVIGLLVAHGFANGHHSEAPAILDVGCATGELAARLRRFTHRLVGIDRSTTAVALAKQKFAQIDFRAGSLPDATLRPQSFDLITCCECLYYLDSAAQQDLLREISNLLKGNGRALVTSVIGPTPYFNADQLTALLAEHFRIEAVESHGSRFFLRLESFFFGKYCQLNRFQKLLQTSRDRIDDELHSASLEKNRFALRLVRLLSGSAVTRRVACMVFDATAKAIKLGLKLKSPARLINRLARTLSWEPSHTFVLIGK
jgi:SAM-dependent methyltransferase